MSVRQYLTLVLAGAAPPVALLDDLSEVTVTEPLLLPASCALRLRDPQLRWLNGGLLSPGAALRVAAGASPEARRAVFSGEIVSTEVAFLPDGPVLSVLARDHSHRLHDIRRPRTFAHLGVATMIALLAREAGMSADLPPLPTYELPVEQANRSNWELLLACAERHGLTATALPARLMLRPPAASAPPYDLPPPDQVAGLRLCEEPATPIATVEVWGFTPQGGLIRARATLDWPGSAPGESLPLDTGILESRNGMQLPNALIVEQPARSQEEAEQLATALLHDLAGPTITCEGSIAGNPGLRAGVVVRAAGLGPRYSSFFTLVEATQTITASGYSTRFRGVRRSPATLRAQVLGQAALAAMPADGGEPVLILPATGYGLRGTHDGEGAELYTPRGMRLQFHETDEGLVIGAGESQIVIDRGQRGLQLRSDGKLTIAANEIEVVARSRLLLEAKGMLDARASAIVSIEGSLVKIN